MQMRDFIERLTSYVDLFRISVAPHGQLACVVISLSVMNLIYVSFLGFFYKMGSELQETNR